MRWVRRPGFWIALLVGGGVFGIAAANLHNALERGRQKESMGRIRTIATAVRLFEMKHRVFPVPATGSIDELRAFLVPEFLESMPTVDGWGRELRYWSDGGNFELRSLGNDGREDPDARPGRRDGYAFDLILRNGFFWQVPHGG